MSDIEKGTASTYQQEQPVVQEQGQQQQEQRSKSINRYNVLNLLAYVLNTVITYGFGMAGWGGTSSNGDISDKYQTIITPSGYAFSIWGLIFILQAIWVIWQVVVPSQRNHPCVDATSYWYVMTSLTQCGWTFAFGYEVIWLSLIFILLIAFSLWRIHVNLQLVDKNWKEYFLWQFNLSLHFGWLVAASSVNVNLMLPAYGATSAVTQLIVASLTLVALLCIAIDWLRAYPVDFTPPCVLVWALGAVYSELQNPKPRIASTFSERQIDGFAYGVITGAGIILIGVALKIAYVLFVQQKRQRTTNNN